MKSFNLTLQFILFVLSGRSTRVGAFEVVAASKQNGHLDITKVRVNLNTEYLLIKSVVHIHIQCSDSHVH